MRLYTVRDRLIDYYMQPFIGPSDKEVMSALAAQINDPENKNAIAQKPSHFELHAIADIHENQHVEPCGQFICDCASLVRGNVRDGTNSRAATPQEALGSRPGPLQHVVGRTDTETGPIPIKAPSAPLQGTDQH